MDSWRDARQAGRVSPFGHLRITALLPAPRSFSQAHAPFVASHRLGIHRMRLFAWPYNPNRPGRGATRAAFSTSLPPPALSGLAADTSPSSSLCFSIPHTTPRPAPWPGAPPRASPKLLKTARGANAPRPRRRTPPPPRRRMATRKRAFPPRLRLAEPRKKNPRTPRRRTPGPAGRQRRRAGGAREDRTPDLLRARQALSQLSYGPGRAWWVWEESNLRPHPYQGCALTN